MRKPAHSKILILDFGSQYTQVIARRIRELQVYSEILPFRTSADQIRDLAPNGIILSGGPASVYDKGAPHPDPEIFSLGIPVLGICYGLMLMAQHLGGKVVFTGRREYGAGLLHIKEQSMLFNGLGQQTDVWNSHGDEVTALPPGFGVVATTEGCDFAAVEDGKRKLYGLQFHPEVVHTPRGKEILQNFVYHICRCAMDWTMGSFVEEACDRVRRQVGDEKVVLGLSGGVDSSVVAALLHKAIGDQLTCIFVNNGLLRAREDEVVQRVFGENFHIKLKYVDATDRFLTKLRGIVDPEQKRKIIGNEFIYVFEDAIKELAQADEKNASPIRTRFLAQGTLYPDVIESVSIDGNPAQVIKIASQRRRFARENAFPAGRASAPAFQRRSSPGSVCSSDCPGKLFTGNLSRDRDSPSAFSAKSRRSDWLSFAKPIRLCKAKWKRVIGTIKCGNHLPCFCRSARSASWGINELTKTRSRYGSSRASTP